MGGWMPSISGGHPPRRTVPLRRQFGLGCRAKDRVATFKSCATASRDRQDDLAELLAVFEALVGIGGALERQDGINHGLQQAAFEKLEHGIQLRLASHKRTQNRELPRKDIIDIELPFGAGGRAA